MRTTKLLVFLSLVTMSSTAIADWSANVGYNSEYYYRGLFQKRSSANGGVDYSKGGFYAGTWIADVGDGLEVDGYFGYGLELADVELSAGFTGYYYTGDFDDTYEELNLSAAYGIASVDVAVGQYDNFDGPTQDYTYYAVTLEKNGFFGRYAGFSQDFAGNYVELGYGTTLSGVDVAATLILSDEDLIGEDDEAFVVSLTKSFDF
ncbi:MAG: hypothetical protein AAF351_06565 [Pseudomonadota bacterium]